MFMHPSDDPILFNWVVLCQFKVLFTDGWNRWPVEPYFYLQLILKVKDIFLVPVVEPNRTAILFVAQK